MATFSEVCEAALGAGDYISLAQQYHTLLLCDIPVIPSSERNVARRFILLIDELYNHHVKLLCTANAPLNELFERSANTEEAFMAARAISRITEMQSERYLLDARME